MPDLTAIRSRANGRPVLADLFSGAGGSARGYQRAGFYVVGVDRRPQPRYVGDEFFQADAMAFPLEGFDAIHASPPCQAYSALTRLGKQDGQERTRLIEPVRQRLVDAGVPYVIENVVGAPMIAPIRLCGSSFGLAVQRHRFFECSFAALAPPCQHERTSIGVYGDHPQISQGMNRAHTLAEAQRAMGIGWMTWPELCEAIPPAYCEWVGLRLMDALKASAA